MPGSASEGGADLVTGQAQPPGAGDASVGGTAEGAATAGTAAHGTGTGRMPAIYLSHGAPPLADDPLWTRQLADWAQALPKPSAVLMVSAHWEAAPLAIGATGTVPLVYDFWGFPEHYYRVSYPAPGAPGLARDVRALLRTAGTPVQDIPGRGLDHGAYVPLAEMYPAADVPVLQISLPTLEPRALFGIGRKLAPLRDEGVLIAGSGFFTHNLRAMSMDGTVPSVMSEFDEWGARALTDGDIDALMDFERKAPGARQAHPRTEHFAPLFVALGAADAGRAGARTVIDGFWYGLAKRSVEVP